MKSRISAEIKEEILLSVTAIEGHIGEVSSPDVSVIQDVMTKASLYFSELMRRLIEKRIASPRDDLFYTLEAIIDVCRDISMGQRVSKFRTSKK